MSRRVPYICGGTKTRDHFQFRRVTNDELFTPGGLPGGDYLPNDTSPPRTIEVPFETAIKWLWRVREWKVEASLSTTTLIFAGSGAGAAAPPLVNWDSRPNPFPPPDVIDPPLHGFTANSDVMRMHLEASFSGTIKSYKKTGPVGIQGYSGAVAVQPETAIETDLLDSFRDSDKFAIFTRGYFGFAPDRVVFPHLGTQPGYPPFGIPENSFDGSGLTYSLTDVSITASAPLVIVEVSRYGFFTFALGRWDPGVPPDNTQPISNDQLLWNSSTKKVKIPYAFGLTYGVLYQPQTNDGDGYIYTDSPGTIGHHPLDNPLSFELSCSGDTDNGRGTMTIDGISFPIFVPIPFFDLGSTATVTVTPTKFWAYKNRLGQPIYDETTGAQINDPFA